MGVRASSTLSIFLSKTKGGTPSSVMDFDSASGQQVVCHVAPNRHACHPMAACKRPNLRDIPDGTGDAMDAIGGNESAMDPQAGQSQRSVPRSTGLAFGVRLRLVLAVAIAGWMGACNLNPQPIPPGVSDGDGTPPKDGAGNGGGGTPTTSDAGAGADATVTQDAASGTDAGDAGVDSGDAGDAGDAGEGDDGGDAGDGG